MKAGTQKKIDVFTDALGITGIEIENAGDFRKFTNTKTQRRAKYQIDGKTFTLPMPNSFGDSGLFYALQYLYGKKTGFVSCPNCAGTGMVWQSNYGSSHQTSCGGCGGYKQVPKLI